VPTSSRPRQVADMTGESSPEQLALVPERKRRVPRKAVAVTEIRGVASVRIDSPVPHLDRAFDYAIPAELDDRVQVGSRVRVRFSGRLVDGYVVARAEHGEHPGPLRPIDRVMGVEPVLTADTLALVDAVAERYAGTFSDVVRAAVPPRHARAESVDVTVSSWRAHSPTPERWSAYAHGASLLTRLAADGAARVAWSSAPATSWARDVRDLALAVLAQDQGGVIVVVPDADDVARVIAEFGDARESTAVLTADMGPERRYREFLRILRGGVRLVVGTRASVFAPVVNLRLIIVWDDGNDVLDEPHAPYWHTTDVAALRSHLSGCHLVVGSVSRTPATQQWCESGWARSIVPNKATLTQRAPRVRALSSSDAARDPAAASARIPHTAWEAARTALQSGPVLVQVARRGYLPALACQGCRELARCSCGGLMRQSGPDSPAMCAWCGTTEWTCAFCNATRMRAVSIGAERTAEEIGRAFPGTPVLSSHAGHVLTDVPHRPALVIATPGAEPDCDPGYAAVLLLDARSMLERPSLDASISALHRWMSAARLAQAGAPVVITCENSLAAVQALVRWDPVWLASREIVERASAGLPPSTRMAALTGDLTSVREVAASLQVQHRLLGPVPDGDDQRGLVVVSREDGARLARELRGITAARSSKSDASLVRVVMDPIGL